MHTGMILIDLQKTSDTLDYKSHFEKITCLDFKTSIIKNVEPYLSKKFFFVSVNDFFLGDGRFKLFLKGLSCSFSYFFKYINDLPNLFQKVNIAFMHMISSYEAKTFAKLKLV